MDTMRYEYGGQAVPPEALTAAIHGGEVATNHYDRQERGYLNQVPLRRYGELSDAAEALAVPARDTREQLSPEETCQWLAEATGNIIDARQAVLAEQL